MSNNPAFIPKDQVVPGADYKGYIAYGEGLVRWDRAPFKVEQPKGRPRDEQVLKVKATPKVKAPDWGVAPIKRRTPQQRAESLANRIWAHVQTFGAMSESVFKEVQAVAWEEGLPITFEQARDLARHYLERNDHLVKEEEKGQVVRKSPYVLDGEDKPEPEKAHPGRLIFTPRGGSSSAQIPVSTGRSKT